jgi:hypothetical protein
MSRNIYIISIDFTPIGSMHSKARNITIETGKYWQRCQHGIHYNQKTFEKALFKSNAEDYTLTKGKLGSLGLG